MRLLSGKFEDPIRISISHEKFNVTDPGLPLESVITPEHRQGLATGWEVHKTFEGRAYYNQISEDGSELGSWTHPDPDFYLREPTNTLLEHNDEGLIPVYEALSYVWGSQDNLEHIYIEDVPD